MTGGVVAERLVKTYRATRALDEVSVEVARAVGLLLGRTVGDLARRCVTLAIVIGLGVAVGLRVRGDLLPLVLTVALLVLASWVFC